MLDDTVTNQYIESCSIVEAVQQNLFSQSIVQSSQFGQPQLTLGGIQIAQMHINRQEVSRISIYQVFNSPSFRQIKHNVTANGTGSDNLHGSFLTFVSK